MGEKWKKGGGIPLLQGKDNQGIIGRNLSRGKQAVQKLATVVRRRNGVKQDFTRLVEENQEVHLTRWGETGKARIKVGEGNNSYCRNFPARGKVFLGITGGGRILSW